MCVCVRVCVYPLVYLTCSVYQDDDLRVSGFKGDSLVTDTVLVTKVHNTQHDNWSTNNKVCITVCVCG